MAEGEGEEGDLGLQNSPNSTSTNVRSCCCESCRSDAKKRLLAARPFFCAFTCNNNAISPSSPFLRSKQNGLSSSPSISSFFARVLHNLPQSERASERAGFLSPNNPLRKWGVRTKNAQGGSKDYSSTYNWAHYAVYGHCQRWGMKSPVCCRDYVSSSCFPPLPLFVGRCN